MGLTGTLGFAGCAKTEEPPASASRDPQIAYVAAKLIPPGKTVRAADGDGSIELAEVPGDIIGGDGIEDTSSIECLVAGRAIPAGTLLRRSFFVQASELGLDRGLTDGTTPDSSC